MIHERIAHVDQKIAVATNDAERAVLYLERGDIFLSDGHSAEALADFERAGVLDPSLRLAQHYRGAALLAIGRPADAAAVFREFLATTEGDASVAGARVDAHSLLGDALLALERPADAAVSYGRAVEASELPSPDHILDHARALAAASRHVEALAALDAGIARLGELVVLEGEAVRLARAAGDVDTALERLDRLVRSSPQPAHWLAERGQLLIEAGRQAEARQAYEAALAALGELPASRRSTRAIAVLEAEITAALKRLP